MRIRLALCALIILATGAAHAAAPVAKDSKDTLATIRKTLTSRFPDVKILDVQPGPVAGLYEVYTGDAITYSDATGDHLFLGPLLDTRTRRNLSADRLEERGAIDFKTLPLAQAIKTVKGNGSRTLAVFSDPDCPFCQKLEQELKSITDVTIYTFLYPIASLHPEATAKAHAIWCAGDHAQAWSQWMLEKKLAPGGSCKDDPIVELQALGEKLHINSTPTLFLASGKRISGTLPAAQLEKMLGNAPASPSAAAGKAGASP